MKKRNFSSHLRFLRENHNKPKKTTQEDMATLLGISLRQYSNWERWGENPEKGTIPQSDNLIRLADYFGTSIDYILERTDFRYTDDESISKELGLSAKAIDMLRIYNHAEPSLLDLPHAIDAINIILEYYWDIYHEANTEMSDKYDKNNMFEYMWEVINLECSKEFMLQYGNKDSYEIMSVSEIRLRQVQEVLKKIANRLDWFRSKPFTAF